MIQGLFKDIPESEYRLAPAINKSGLDDFEKSPLHYWARHLDPNREAREVTSAMRLGTAIHCATLEPHRFSKEYVAAIEGLDRRTKEGKARFEEFVKANEVRNVLSAEDFDVCNRLSTAMRSSAAGSILFADGDSEVTIFWNDPATGVSCKARVDWIAKVDGQVFLVDVKSTRDASRNAFRRAIYDHRYYRQAEWYLDGFEIATGIKAAGFIFAACETSSPYACAFYQASAAMIAHGATENQRLLTRYAECLNAAHWPSYSDLITEIDLPAWVKPEAVEMAQPEAMETY